MATPTEHAQEQLSRAYIRAIAAEARVKYQWKNDPDYGIDGEFQQMAKNAAGNLFANGYPLEFQLKASTNCIPKGNKVAYDLDVKTYNNLLLYSRQISGVCLLVYDMPDAEGDWMDCSPRQLVLRSCCYYWIPSGTPSNNSSTQRIKINKADTLTPHSLRRLFQQLVP